jgi:cytochrome c-type biogenesis protein CcmH
MIIFWTLAAAMLLLGVWFVVRPLLRPGHSFMSGRQQHNIDIARERLKALENEYAQGIIDQKMFDQAYLEIEQILANDLGSETEKAISGAKTAASTGTAVTVGLAVPLATLLMYGFLGNAESLNVNPGQEQSSVGRATNPGQLASVDDMVGQLAERLKENPGDPNGWRLLARSYLVMERYPEAIEALRRARGLVGDDPDVLVELAEAIARAQDNSFEGQPSALLAQALEKAPENPSGLWLAGRSALIEQNLPLALDYWHKLKAVLPEDAEGAESVRLAIAKVEEALGQAAGRESPITQSERVTAESSQPSITVKVGLDKALMAAVDLDDTVFIYAQALTGPPIPLAISRKKVRDLPLQIKLNDSMAMTPAMTLSNFPQVRVVARISKSGNAIPQTGDFKGQAEPVTVDENLLVEILIAERIR